MHTYIARMIAEIDNGPGRWKYARVGVFRVEGGQEEQIGEYERNYPKLFDTFTHFVKDGRDYALYSPDYTATRILDLPSCKDIGGEKHDSHGFCPIEYFVPTYAEAEYEAGKRKRINNPKAHTLTPIHFYSFGFVAGTIWAEDEFTKIQYLDISEAEKGIIKRDDRFGYVMIPNKMTLRDVIDMENYHSDPVDVADDDIYCHGIYLTIRARFDLRDGKLK